MAKSKDRAKQEKLYRELSSPRMSFKSRNTSVKSRGTSAKSKLSSMKSGKSGKSLKSKKYISKSPDRSAYLLDMLA